MTEMTEMIEMTEQRRARRRLARPKQELEADYDAVVIGSGYGGGIAALRLAEAGLRVCVLERGTERLPEEFPEAAWEAPHNIQATIETSRLSTRVGDRLALFDVRVHDGVSVVVGCGVGGTSLINANVWVVPDAAHFASGWPAALAEDQQGRDAAMMLAQSVLRPTDAGPELEKMALMREVGEQLGRPATRLALMVHRETAPEDCPDAVEFRACTGCGNCCSGCRVGAKRTVDATYLAKAVALGASVFAELDVRSVAKSTQGWRVHYAPVCRPIDDAAPEPWITARVVVIAAGALGSTEVLARSRARGLAISPALGSSFSANGNTMGAIESPRLHVRGTGTSRNGESEPGPCITMAIEVPATADRPAIHIEDGTVPSPLGPLARLVGMRERIAAAPLGVGIVGRATHALSELAATAAEAATDADEHALALLVQHDDGAAGRLELTHDRIAVRWPDYGAHVGAIDDTLAQVARGLGGSYRPLRTKLRGRTDHLTVHPLGGCPMGEDRYDGVVDHACRVFDPTSPARDGVYEGLYVCDGSVVPKAAGKNPVGTICVVAERAMKIAAQHWRGREGTPSSTRSPGPRAMIPVAAQRRTFAMTEAFTGWLTAHIAHDPGELPPSGLATPIAAPASAHFNLEMTDFAAFRASTNHAAGVLGTITCAVLGGTCAVVRGTAYLLSDDPVEASQSYNLYDLLLLGEDGRRWQLGGTKVWENGGPGRLWAAGTQMVVEVFEHDGGRGAKVASGLLRMSAGQFLGSVRSYEGRVGKGVADAVRTRAAFLAFGATSLWKRVRPR